MKYDVRLETAAACPTAVVRRRAAIKDLPKVIPEACGLVWNVVRAEHIPGAGRHVALYLDDAINVEVGVELEAPLSGAGHGEVVSSTLPAGRVAATTHFGPYPQLGQAHDAIRDWSKSNGHALAGPCWEIYGHWQDEWNHEPSKIRTDVYYLLK